MSHGGKDWVRLRASVGKDDAMQWVIFAVSGKAAESAGELEKTDRVYIEGTISMHTWRAKDSAERQGLNVAAFGCVPTHHIRKRPQRDGKQQRINTNSAPLAANRPAASEDIGF